MSRRRIATLVFAALFCAVFAFLAAVDVRRLVTDPFSGWNVAALLLDGGLAAAYGWWFVTRLLRSKAGGAK